MRLNDVFPPLISVFTITDGVLRPGDPREPERSDWLPNPSPSEGNSGQTQGWGAQWENHDLEHFRHRSNIFRRLRTGWRLNLGRLANHLNFLFSGFCTEIVFRWEEAVTNVWTSLRSILTAIEVIWSCDTFCSRQSDRDNRHRTLILNHPPVSAVKALFLFYENCLENVRCRSCVQFLSSPKWMKWRNFELLI